MESLDYITLATDETYYKDQLGFLRHPLLQLISPLSINVIRKDGYAIAICEEFEEFGYGLSVSDAIKDFQGTLSELYSSLKNDRKNLSKHLLTLLEKLEDKIVERHR